MGPSDIDQGGLLAVVWIGFGVATVLTAFRLYVRRIRLGRYFWDDAFHLLAWSCLLVGAALLTWMANTLYDIRSVTTGASPLTAEFLETVVPRYVLFEFVSILLFWATIWSVKFAFLLFYRRFFTGLTSHMVAWWAVLFFTTATLVGVFVPFLVVCGSPEEYFQIGQCLSVRSIHRTKVSIINSTTMDVLSDVMIMALPMRILWSLHITRRQKLGLAAVFSLAMVVIVFAIVRAVETLHTLTPSALSSLEGSDPISLTLFSVLESTIAVIVSCLPTFRVYILSKPTDSNRYQSDGENGTLGFSFSSSVMRSCSQKDRFSGMSCGLPVSVSGLLSGKGWNGSGGDSLPGVNGKPPNASYKSYEKRSKHTSWAPHSQRTVESDRTLVGTPMTEFAMKSPKPVAREWPKLSYFDTELGTNKPLPPVPRRASTPLVEAILPVRSPSADLTPPSLR